MLEDGVITQDQAKEALATPLTVTTRPDSDVARADWFAEEVRRELAQKYGEKRLYEGGLSVRTTMDPRLQAIGEKALRDGLEAYDRRAGGWRGPPNHTSVDVGWPGRLNELGSKIGRAHV